jgi:hypothetical protein
MPERLNQTGNTQKAMALGVRFRSINRKRRQVLFSSLGRPGLELERQRRGALGRDKEQAGGTWIRLF